MNEAPEVSDYKDDKDFDIDEAKNTETQVDSEEGVEDEEINNNNDFFEDGNKSNDDEDKTPYIRNSNRIRHLPNNLIPNMAGGRLPYEEGTVNLQV